MYVISERLICNLLLLNNLFSSFNSSAELLRSSFMCATVTTADVLWVYLNRGKFTNFMMSFTNIMKRMGTKTEHWCTPRNIGSLAERALLTVDIIIIFEIYSELYPTNKMETNRLQFHEYLSVYQFLIWRFNWKTINHMIRNRISLQQKTNTPNLLCRPGAIQTTIYIQLFSLSDIIDKRF